VAEELPLINPYKGVIRRLAAYILELCRNMSIKGVAEHRSFDWKTVKGIHKRNLQEKYSRAPLGNPQILLVDEIAIIKGQYVPDLDRGL
jgi:hypothetical protein